MAEPGGNPGLENLVSASILANMNIMESVEEDMIQPEKQQIAKQRSSSMYPYPMNCCMDHNTALDVNAIMVFQGAFVALTFLQYYWSLVGVQMLKGSPLGMATSLSVEGIWV